MSLIGSIASIVSIGLAVTGITMEGWVGVGFLGIITLFFMAYNFYLINTYHSKSKYADAFADINIGFSKLHSLRRKGKELKAEDIIRNMESLCEYLSNAFSRIYGSRIGVCIKYIVSENNRPKVMTLARDNYSSTNQRKSGERDKKEHWIELNTDFQYIYKNFNKDNIDTSFFFEPHLPIKQDYQNTRLEDSWYNHKWRKYFKNKERRRLWPLKYRSTLVVPIVPLSADEQEQGAIRGFLCIDSPKEGAFNITYDVDILKGASDGIYNQIDKLLELLNREL